MELSDDARAILENRVTRILKAVDIPDSDKKEIKKELISNYTDASIMKAQARGAQTVGLSDVELALETAEPPEEIASMYMVSYTESLERAGLLTRSAAFIVDYVISSVCGFILTMPFFLLVSFSGGQPPKPSLIPLMMQSFNLFMTLNLAIVLIYFVISEGYYGYTPGKWILGLKVLKADGRKLSYQEALVRNIPKLFILAILVDGLLMVFSGKDKQRLFDKIAGTIVIERN